MKQKCLGCGDKMQVFSKNHSYTIYRCGRCGLGYTENLNAQKGGYHRDDVYIGERMQFQNIFQKRADLLRRFVPAPGKVLEIGSSTGLLLTLLKKEGWEVLGVEVSPKAADYATGHGVATVTGEFEKIKLPEHSFDAVVLNQTLEHLQSPGKVLEKIYGLLKNGGVLLVDVPNFGSLSSQIMGGQWPYLLPEEHRWHFTIRSLKMILENSNFWVIFHSTASGIWDYNNPWLEIWQALSGIKKRLLGDVLTAVPSLFVSLTGLGTGLMVVARKGQ